MAGPPVWLSVPLAYLGIGVAMIVATCTAPMAPTNAASTKLGSASVIASAVAMLALAIFAAYPKQPVLYWIS